VHPFVTHRALWQLTVLDGSEDEVLWWATPPNRMSLLLSAEEGYACERPEPVATLRTEGGFDLVLLDAHLPDMDGRGSGGASERPDLAPVRSSCSAETHRRPPPVPRVGRRRLSPAGSGRPCCGTAERRVDAGACATRRASRARYVARKSADFLPESLPSEGGATVPPAAARQVSGDFYDAFLTATSGTIVLVVGTLRQGRRRSAVHGCSAASSAPPPIRRGRCDPDDRRRALVRQSLNLRRRPTADAVAGLQRLHRQAARRTNCFATVLLGGLDPGSGQLDYSTPVTAASSHPVWRTLGAAPPSRARLGPDAAFRAGEATLERATPLRVTDGWWRRGARPVRVFGARASYGTPFGETNLRHYSRRGAPGSAPRVPPDTPNRTTM